MSDLISRQEAIDAIKAARVEEDGVRAWRTQRNIDLEFAAGMLDTIPSAQTWIPVAERLPEDGVFVLTCNDEGKMIVAKYESEVPEWEFKYCNYDWDVWDDEEQGVITAWMPLPEPWRGDSDEID